MLKLADNLSVPLDVVTEKLAFLGGTGSGKTYAATKLAELMLDAGAQIVVLDVVGVWYGLRVGLDSQVYIFGGLHGDIPLEAASGPMIADLIVDRGISAVLDISQFETDADLHRLAIGFGKRFFFRKKAQRSAVHLFVEECQELFPQNPMGGENNVLHEYNRIWKIGRNFGIGGSLISQRPQEVNKKALNLAGTVFVFRMTGPQERKTIEGWVKDKGINEDVQALLPKLETGSPKVWSPSFLEVSKTIHILKKKSADISKTPKVGDSRAVEKPLTKIDLEQLKTQMAATIEKAKAEDPKELRKQLAELQKQLKQRPAEIKTIEKTVEVKVPVLTDADWKRLEKLQQNVLDHGSEAMLVAKAISDALWQIKNAVSQFKPAVAQKLTAFPAPQPRVKLGPQRRVDVTKHGVAGSNDTGQAERLPIGELKILTAIAQHGSAERDQLTVLTGYKRSSRDAYLQRLQSRAYIEITANGIEPTQEGMIALGPDFEPLPTGDQLRYYWLEQLPVGEMKILTETIKAYPKAVDRETLSDSTDYKRSSRDAYIQRLQSRRLIETTGRGEVRASDNLFTSEKNWA
jgi:hypothetical protein